MNSMEQDIKNLQEIINLCNEELDNEDENVTAVLDLVDLKSLRNLINRNKELEEENRIFALEGSKVRLKIHIDKNYIPVSLVEEKIEELKENGYWNYLEERDLETTIGILQELLEKR
jgi:hypothetical protein